MRERALIPKLVQLAPERLSGEFWVFSCGLLLLASLAQISFPLPWTPVPITGQTFGCTLIALTWGSRRAPAILFAYLALGALGAPVFADGASGIVGATSGYLGGMLLASWLMGYMADRGWATGFRKSFLAALAGMLVIYAAGLSVLSLYLPYDKVLMAGFWPFLPGDILKCAAAAFLVQKAQEQAAL